MLHLDEESSQSLIAGDNDDRFCVEILEIEYASEPRDPLW
jgi:hypothetical protein